METVRYSEQLATEAAKRSREIAEEAAKKADGGFKELAREVVEAVKLKGMAAIGGGKEKERVVKPEELEEYGVTEELREFVIGLTLKTFKEFPLNEVENMSNISAPSQAKPGRDPSVSQDLSEFQEHHARLMLQVVSEISDFRYCLCPRRMTEKTFWKIYFILVRSHISPYEERAVKKAAMKKAEIEMTTTLDATKIEEGPKIVVPEPVESASEPAKAKGGTETEEKPKLDVKVGDQEQDLDDYLMGALNETTGDDEDEGDFDPDDFEQFVNQSGSLDSPDMKEKEAENGSSGKSNQTASGELSDGELVETPKIE